MRSLIVLALALLLAGCLDSDALPETSDVVTEQPDAVEVTWGELDSATIRPGASLGGYCTFNFLYEGANGTGYIGTAAHCTELGERVELPGVGQIGTVVYDSDESEGADGRVDFSLIALDGEQIASAHPMMLGYDGPTGNVTTADLAVGDVVSIHGYGLILGQNDVTRDRSGVLTSFDEQQYNIDMPAVNGDSGSPILHESGMALGIISHYGFGAVPPSTDEGPLMGFIFEELAKAGFEDVVLATV